MPLLSVRDIAYSHPGSHAPIQSGCTLSVRPGEVVAVLVNWSREEQKYSLVCPAGSASGVIPPMSYWRIPLNM